MGPLSWLAPLTSADLPCRYHERNDNVLPNRVLLAGLHLARRIAIDPNVRLRTFYATAATGAQEARIWINDPLQGQMRAQVRLRPVVLSEFAEIVASTRTAKTDRRRREYAAYLSYGSSESRPLTAALGVSA